jgi:transposase
MKNNNIKMAKRQYGLVKEVVAEGCQKNMSAKEISDETGISKHTIYSVANRMGMRPRYVKVLKKKFAHGGLTKAVCEYYKNNMTVKQIAEKVGYDTDSIRGIIRKKGLKNKPFLNIFVN